MTTRPWPCSAISVSVKCLPSRAADTRPPRPRRAPHDVRFWNHMGKRRLQQGNANPGANIGLRGTPMISRASGRAWLPMFLLSVAHGADLSSPTRSLPQSCDAVRTVAVPWPKQHHIRPTGNAYRCAKNDDDDCIDLSGNRLRNTQGRRIWRLDR